MKTIIIKESSLKSLKPYVNPSKKVTKVNSGLMMYEGSDMEEDVDPNSVDLSSFEIQNRLHPKFWQNNKLDSRVRLKLLDIADDFLDFMGTDWVDPDDIIMTGSLANFNWSEKYSDIDLHIVMDYDKIDENREMVERFLKAQTMLWAKDHEDLNICGFPVEIYVQNYGENLKAGGIYSLEKNEWLKEPQREDLTSEDLDKRWIQKRSAKFMDKIDSLCERFEKAKDDFQIERIDLSASKLFQKIKDERASGFEKTGKEMNNKNIVFKTLRRQGYIGKLKDLQKNIYNKLNSL